MELTEDEYIQKYGKYCGHCNRNSYLTKMNLVAYHVDITLSNESMNYLRNNVKKFHQ